MKNVVLVFSFLVLAFANIARAGEDKVIWSCKKPYGKENILWLVEWGGQSYIKVFDERIPATYEMSGLTKRWNWDLDGDDHTYKYAITLGADMVAKYFDFTTSSDGTATSKATYNCKKG